MNPVFTLYPDRLTKVGSDIALTDIVSRIQHGAYAARVSAVREAYAGAGGGAAGKAAAAPFKGVLPGVTFSGRFGMLGRTPAGLIGHSGLICADLDTLGDSLAHVRAVLLSDTRTVALFLSPSGDGLKVVFRCDPTRPHKQAFTVAKAHIQFLTGADIDEACKDVSRLCYVSHDPDAYLAPNVSAVPVLDYPPGTMDGFDEAASEGQNTDGDNGDPETIERARAHVAGLPAAVSGQGGHAATFKAALALAWGFGLNDETAFPLLLEYNARCVPAWSDDELHHKLESARQDVADKPPFRWLRPIAGAPIEAADFATDLDASARFAKAHADKLRYAPGLGWLVWDGTRWAEDATGQAMELAKTAARSWTQFASAPSNETEARGRRIKAALALEGVGHIKAAVELAKSDARMVLSSDRLDADPYLLNVRNGTLDLRTGELRPHRREDFISKLAPVDYVPGATHPTLTKYLATVEAQTPDMTAFLARCFGAALTGDASPESLFLLQGDGGSGKTTLVEAMSAMLGDYAAKLPFASLVLSKHGRGPGSASPDLLKLRRARLAYASEGDQRAQLDAGLVKELTGDEVITARGLYKDPVEFLPTWKLWLVSNFDPRADSEDTGIWRRMMKIRFAAIPEPDRDPRVKTSLRQDPAARSALLAWALAGCRDWQTRGGGRIGLAMPPAVKAETEAYQKKQDVLGQWWDDLIATEATLKPSGRTSSTLLRRNYDDWTRENGERAVTSRRFADFLRGKGLTDMRGTGGARYWRGIEIEAEHGTFFVKTPTPPAQAA